MAKKRAAGEIVAATLAGMGVREVFGLHGSHVDPFLIACSELGIRITDTRHEAAAGHAADGFARTSNGKLGVCVSTAGPGFTNTLTAIANAYLDRIPVLFISGAAPLREAEANTLQGGFDTVAMAKPVTKWAHRITDVERIGEFTHRAAEIALTGSPGPVFLEIPIDVMFMPTDQEPTPSSPLEAAELSAPAPAAIEKLVDVLSKSERPVIVVGGGAIFGNSAEKLRRFVELAGIPVIASAKAIGILPDDHPFYGGPAAALAMAGAEGTRPDTVLLLGARMGMFLGGLSDAVIPSGAFVAQVEINPDEIGRVRRSNLPIVADCSLVLDDLLDKTKSRKWSKKTEWAETLRRHKVRSQTLFADASKRSARGAMHPYHAVKAVLDALPPEVVIVSDGGETGNWVGDFGRSSGPGQFLRCGYLGCLGVAPGFAIGAARARPDRPVICFTGDGAAGFNIQEFDTMVRHDLPILTVILNNAAWGMSRNAQLLLYGANREVIVSLASTDYDIVAKGFGLSGIRIDDPEEIGPSVKRALQSRKPMCLNLIVDADIMHPRTRAMVGDVSGADGIPIPYYANIPKKSA